MSAPDLSTVIVSINDIRRAGYCVAGARSWCTAHGIPFAEFLKSGLPADEFIHRGDALAQLVVDRKLERENDHG
jgi:hypothetical protein